MTRKILTSITAGVASVALGSTAAFASNYDFSDFTVDDIRIELSAGLLPDEFNFSPGVSSDLDDALDENTFAFWNDSDNALMPYQEVRCINPTIDTPDSSGDSVISCDPSQLSDDQDSPVGLEATPELRVWSDKALTRYVVTLENTSEASIEYSWEWNVDFGSGDAFYATSSEFPFSGYDQDVQLEEADLAALGAHWSISPGDPDRVINGDEPPLMIRDLPSTIAWGNVVGGFGAENLDVSSDEIYLWNNDDDEQGQLSLEPGESISFAVFNFATSMRAVYGTDPLAGDLPIAKFDAAMEALYEASTAVFGGSGGGLVSETAVPCDELFVGVNSSEIANWDCSTSEAPITTPVTAPAPPTLAKTGADFQWLLVSGLTAAVVGSSLLAISRRKRTA
jgi:LPXTG-motif cell wall-anchored protein